jgi:hypothetical protein
MSNPPEEISLFNLHENAICHRILAIQAAGVALVINGLRDKHALPISKSYLPPNTTTQEQVIFVITQLAATFIMIGACTCKKLKTVKVLSVTVLPITRTEDSLHWYYVEHSEWIIILDNVLLWRIQKVMINLVINSTCL